jgi:hypothetical protein
MNIDSKVGEKKRTGENSSGPIRNEIGKEREMGAASV